jgi:hypothetical protein
VGNVKKLAPFLVIFIFLTFPCGEIPELSNLTDDTSNDFVLAASNQESMASEIYLESSPAIPGIILLVGESQDHPQFAAAEPPLVAGRDLLQMVSLQLK